MNESTATCEQSDRPVDVVDGHTLAAREPPVRPLQERAREVVGIRLDVEALQDLKGRDRAAGIGGRVRVGHAPDVGVHRRLEQRVARRVLEGLHQERHRFTRTRGVHDLAEGEQGVRPPPAWCDVEQGRPEQGIGALGVAGAVAGSGRTDAQRRAPVRVAHEAGGAFEEVGRHARSATDEREIGGILQLRRDRRVRRVDGCRAMHGAFERIVGGVGEGQAERSSLAGRRVGVAGRGEQRMGRPQPCPLRDEDPGAARLVDGAGRPGPEDPLQQTDRRL